MSTTPGPDRTVVLTEFNKAITGMSQWPNSQQNIVLQQNNYTPSTLVTKLQSVAAPLQAVVTLRSNLTTALTQREEALPAAAEFIAAFFSVLPQYLPAGTDVSTFGDKPKKARAKLTVAQKEAANVKRQATRAARHIMGKKQRLAIEAPAATTTTTAPVTATTAAVKTGT